MKQQFLIYDFEGTKRAIKTDIIIGVEVRKVDVLRFNLRHNQTLSFRCESEKEAEKYFNDFLEKVSENRNHIYIDLEVI